MNYSHSYIPPMVVVAGIMTGIIPNKAVVPALIVGALATVWMEREAGYLQ